MGNNGRYNPEAQFEQWEKGWAYHQIPTGRSLQTLLEAQCSLEFLQEWNVYFAAKDSALRDSYIELFLRKDNRHYYLQMTGYTERPRWTFSGHDRYLKWRSDNLPHKGLQQSIEAAINAYEKGVSLVLEIHREDVAIKAEDRLTREEYVARYQQRTAESEPQSEAEAMNRYAIEVLEEYGTPRAAIEYLVPGIKLTKQYNHDGKYDTYLTTLNDIVRDLALIVEAT